MVTPQILVEHGHFLRKLFIADQQAQKSSIPPKYEAICHILGARSFLFFDGAWSLLKFGWNMVIFQILAEQG